MEDRVGLRGSEKLDCAGVICSGERATAVQKVVKQH